MIIFYSILIIVLAYLLGSLPFGYVFSKISGKEILKIGWRKTSGSNVFRNVGKWQGVFTGLLDVGKGFLAVFLAQKLGFLPPVQALCGVAAVTGHNWSCFLKFSGGRGIGTLGGALLALSPTILGIGAIPLAVLALIWNAAIGTIVSLITVIALSIYLGQVESAGILSILVLLPVFIKRLSPWEEIKKAKNKSWLVKNRLLFDDDRPRFDLRIQRILKKISSKKEL